MLDKKSLTKIRFLSIAFFVRHLKQKYYLKQKMQSIFCQVSIFVRTAILSSFVSNLLEFCKKFVLSSFFSFEKKSEGRKLKVCLQPYLKS